MDANLSTSFSSAADFGGSRGQTASHTAVITDFSSFYCLESTAIGNTKYPVVRAAYLFYYASETALSADKRAWRKRINDLMNDALISAKKVSGVSHGGDTADRNSTNSTSSMR